MASKSCAICGKSSGMYPLCKDCFILKDKGEVIKCDKCGEWHLAKEKCKEQKQSAPIKEEPKKVYKSEQYTKQAIIKKEIEDIDERDPRKKWEAVHQCDDGHYVRSYSEVLIDNWLYHNGYLHAYEKSVFMPKNPDEIVLSDFYLPKGNIYIEFWGINNNDRYANRKEFKIELYKNNNFNLINLYENDIKRLNDVMPRLIYEFVKEN